MINTVYVLQDPGKKSILPAEKFGKLRVILTGKESPEDAVEKLHKVLSNIQPNDFLLPIGHPINIGLGIAIATYYSENYSTVTILNWNRESYTYNKLPLNTKTYDSSC